MTRGSYRDKILVAQWLTLVVLTLALVVGYVEFQNLASCTNDYFSKSQAVQRIRAEALQKNDQAVDTMVEEVLAATDGSQVRVAMQHYREQRRQVEETRNKNPVPTPPNHC